MKKRESIRVVGGVLTGAAALSPAGPLDATHLPADARLIAHADFDALRASDVGRFLIEHPTLGPMPMVERLKHDVGVDAKRDVRGITLFTVQPCMAHTVAVLTCTGDGLASFMARMAAGELPDFEHGGEPGMEYWSWRRREQRTFAAARAGASADEHQIIFADSVEQLRDTQTLLSAPPVTPADGQPTPRPGSCVFVWVRDFGDCETWRPQAQVLRHTSSVLIDVGVAPRPEGSEQPPQIFGAATVEADSEASAGLMRQVLTGTLAMYELGVQDEPGGVDAAHVLRQVESDVNGARLRITWSPDGTRMMAALKALTAGDRSEKAAEVPTGTGRDIVPGGSR